MKKILLVVAATAVVAGAAGMWWAATPAVAQSVRSTPDIVLVRCDSRGGGFQVTAYSASSSGPQKRTSECAETLSILAREGFVVRDTGYPISESGTVIFTLGR